MDRKIYLVRKSLTDFIIATGLKEDADLICNTLNLLPSVGEYYVQAVSWVGAEAAATATALPKGVQAQTLPWRFDEPKKQGGDEPCWVVQQILNGAPIDYCQVDDAIVASHICSALNIYNKDNEHLSYRVIGLEPPSADQ